ncbi:MAG TPA: YdcF family protein [Allocoleopsis sp.]
MANLNSIGITQLTISSALAMIFLVGGCTEDSLPPPTAPFPTESSSLPNQTKSAKPSLNSLQKTSQKQAIFVLGGAAERERFAAKFAQKHPGLPIWVSSGSPEAYARKIFARAGINKSRVHLDYQALDTVTNFTTLVDVFQAQGIGSVYLITSSDHMRRARVIGEIVLGSRGIGLKPVPVPTQRMPEPPEKCLRDGMRALLWLGTNSTDASVGEGTATMAGSKPDYSQKLDECYR